MPPGARVSEHFSFAELVATDHRVFMEEQFAAPPAVRANLVRLAVDILEPARAIVGPLRVNSGYRCPNLNATISGHPKSAHLNGLAADVWPLEASVVDAYERIMQSSIPYDQIILELPQYGGGWIHVAAARRGLEHRRQALMMFQPGKYEKFARNDPRVRGTEV